MAKAKEKIKAINLREKGKSIKEITEILNVSKGTVSVWCRDVKLSKIQIRRLEEKMKRASYAGRLKGAQKQRQKRLDIISYLQKQGQKEISNISKHELMLIGLALYWGEGSKKGNKVMFSNSDPEVIKLITKWFRKIFKINKQDFSYQIGINIDYKKRIKNVEKYWMKITSASKNQFQKPSFKKVKNKKQYKNADQHFGTLRISVKKSSDLLYRINGLIKAINKAV